MEMVKTQVKAHDLPGGTGENHEDVCKATGF